VRGGSGGLFDSGVARGERAANGGTSKRIKERAI
jgi:hypothetical protein